MTQRPYRITAQYPEGWSAWTGRRTRSFASLEAARSAALQLAVEIHDINPRVATIDIRFMGDDKCIGRLVERMELDVA